MSEDLKEKLKFPMRKINIPRVLCSKYLSKYRQQFKLDRNCNKCDKMFKTFIFFDLYVNDRIKMVNSFHCKGNEFLFFLSSSFCRIQ